MDIFPVPVLSRSALFAGLVLFLVALTAPDLGAGESSAEGRLVYPNPFRGSEPVTFTLTIPPPGEHIRINIYDVLGRHVRQLFPEDPSVRETFHYPGVSYPQWDGNDSFGIPVTVGPYFCVLAAGDNIVRTVKVIKIRE